MPVDERLARLVRQHAQTSRLMGVDFVPAYRVPGSPWGEPEVAAPGDEPERQDATPDRAPAAAPSSPEPASRRSQAPSPPVAAAAAPSARPARDATRVSALLDDLRRRYETDAPHAQFGTQFTNIVFGEGDPCARVAFVGEAPGEEEDKTGRPFVGRAGQLLEKMIIAMGLSRAEVYICNVLKTRPPNNRPPTPEEVVASCPYLYEQLAIVEPEVIVTLGRPATHLLLRTQDAMGRLRGVWGEFLIPPPPVGGAYAGDYAGMRFPVMPTYHPSFLLRSYTDENRKAVWSDLKQVLARLGLEAPARG